jgi:hypothetical protein
VIRRRVSRIVQSTCLGACLLVSATAASAQTADAAPVTGNQGNQQVVSANPFLLMFKWFNVEYARTHKVSTAWGASTSLTGYDHADYGNVSGFYRYYPQGHALNGLYIGGRGGVHKVSSLDESGVFFGLGFEIGYDWMLGREKNFSLGVGAGATRLFGGSLNGVSLTVPTLRLVNIGWSF